MSQDYGLGTEFQKWIESTVIPNEGHAAITAAKAAWVIGWNASRRRRVADADDTIEACARYAEKTYEPTSLGKLIGNGIRTLKGTLLAATPSEPTREWIPVSLRRPQHAEIVWVWDKGWNTSYECMYCEDDDDGSFTWDPASDRQPPKEITHWMPRPSAPGDRKVSSEPTLPKFTEKFFRGEEGQSKPAEYGVSKSQDKRLRIQREFLKRAGSKDGKARAAKYDKATLSKWAKKGGRPPKKGESK